jgi:pimeloyl-ACP methyl ester carboxylesterase
MVTETLERVAVTPQIFRVPVSGGTLSVARWAGAQPVVLAAHGITANFRSFAPLAEETAGRVTLLAPDLRGRAGSSGLPGPYGISSHVADLLAVLDHFEVERAVVLGHSMGAWVAASLAATAGDRVDRLVLVDGGYTLPVPAGTDPEAALQALIGPALERLSMTFPSRAAYQEFWRAHPAFRHDWSPAVEAYIDHDLTGAEPQLRSSVNREAVLADAADTLTDVGVSAAVVRVRCPTVFLHAERGMFDQPPGLYDDERLDQLRRAAPHVRLRLAPDVNHYTVTLSPRGAKVVAQAILAPPGTPPAEAS